MINDNLFCVKVVTIQNLLKRIIIFVTAYWVCWLILYPITPPCLPYNMGYYVLYTISMDPSIRGPWYGRVRPRMDDTVIELWPKTRKDAEMKLGFLDSVFLLSHQPSEIFFNWLFSTDAKEIPFLKFQARIYSFWWWGQFLRREERV